MKTNFHLVVLYSIARYVDHQRRFIAHSEELLLFAENLERKDAKRLASVLSAPPSTAPVKPVDDDDDVVVVTLDPKVIVAMYELLQKPHLLELSEFSGKQIRENCMHSLCRWDPAKDEPHVPIADMACGIMILSGCMDTRVQKWATRLSFANFDAAALVPSLHLLLKHYERISAPKNTSIAAALYLTPPAEGFYKALFELLTKIARVPHIRSALSKVNFLSRIGTLITNRFPPTASMDIVNLILRSSNIFISSQTSPTKLQFPSLALSQASTLLDYALTTSQAQELTDKALKAVDLGFALSVEDPSLETLSTKISQRLADYFKINPTSTLLSRAIKSLCTACFQHAPPLRAPESVHRIWVDLVDPEQDVEVLDAAMSAEAAYMRRAIMDEVHGMKAPHSIFPQRTIVASIVHVNHAPRLLSTLLRKCANLAILDLGDAWLLNPKQKRYCLDFMKEILSVVTSCHGRATFTFTDNQLHLVGSVALYWLVSPRTSREFSEFLLKYMQTHHPKAMAGSAAQLLATHFVTHAVTGLRALLWDLVMYKYDICKSSWIPTLEWAARLFECDAFTKHATANHLLEELLTLSWLLIRHVLAPLGSKDLIRGQLRLEDAVPAALRLMTSIFSNFCQSSVCQQALMHPQQWFNVILSIGLREHSTRHHIPLKTLLSVIRGQLTPTQLQIAQRHFGTLLTRLSSVIDIHDWEPAPATTVPAPSIATAAPSSKPSAPAPREQEKAKTVTTVNAFSLMAGAKPSSSSSLKMDGGPIPYATNLSTLSSAASSSSSTSKSASSSKLSSAAPSKTMPPPGPVKRPLPASVAPRAPIVSAEPEMSFQDRKELDAELQLKETLKRKREAAKMGATPGGDGLVIRTASDLNGPKDSLFNRDQDHHEARLNRVRSLDDLFLKILPLSFEKLQLPDSLPKSVISNRFSSVDEYVSAFEPLLLLELQAQLQNAKADVVPTVETRSIKYIAEIGPFQEFTIDRADGWKTHDVLVMVPKSPSFDIRKFLQQPGTTAHCLAVITKDKKKQRDSSLKGYLTIEKNTMKTIAVRVLIAGAHDHRGTLHSKLQIGSEWLFLDFFSMGTVCREWQALQSVASLSFHRDILDPSIGNQPQHQFTPIQVKQLADNLTNERLFNQSQRNAVYEATLRRGFSFIQGPPGTGKTRTLVGLLSLLYTLNATPILVCTPSNSAIDEVVERIMARGLFDITNANKDSYTNRFQLVRIGDMRNISPKVEAVTLKNLRQLKVDKVQTIEEADNAILKGADIVCCTLSTSGSGALTRLNIPFRTVVIDEAAQAVELSTLIPLQYRADQCILIGDPQQLPATVFSTMAANFLYERSLFARFAATMDKARIMLLDTQYRMHPIISYFPNKNFYDGRLKDGVAESASPWSSSQHFSALRFFDLPKVQKMQTSRSYGNPEEVKFIVNMILKLIEMNPKIAFAERIVVITPYRLQRELLMTAFNHQANTEIVFKTIEVCTVDSYQGKEKSIVILSTVRGQPGRSIGFLSDLRRMNVALTRAKQSLWIVGQSDTLTVNPEWSKLIDSVRERSCLTTVDKSPEEWWKTIE